MRFLFAVARWGQRNTECDRHLRARRVSIRCREMGTAEHQRGPVSSALDVSIRCREMGTAEHHVPLDLHVDRECCFYSLSRDGDSGTRRGARPGTPGRGFYSLSRDGDSGTLKRFDVVIYLGDVSIRCREMGTAEPQTCRSAVLSSTGFYSLSRDGDSGTATVDANGCSASVSIRCREMGTAERIGALHATADLRSCFYSLSRDGDSGTPSPLVAGSRKSFYSLSRDGDSGTDIGVGSGHGSARFLFAVARWGQRNGSTARSRVRPSPVSIRCREMGTAELGQ